MDILLWPLKLSGLNVPDGPQCYVSPAIEIRSREDLVHSQKLPNQVLQTSSGDFIFVVKGCSESEGVRRVARPTNMTRPHD